MEQRGLAAAGIGVLAIGPVAAAAGGWAPLAGVAAAVVLVGLRRVPSPRWSRNARTAAVLDVLCAMCAAGVLARGFGDYLVPGYGRAAAIAALALGGLGVTLRARCPGVVVWLAAAFGALAAVLFVGAGFGIAPAPHRAADTSPWLLPLGAGLLLAPAAAVPARGRGIPWWLLGTAACFGLLALVTVRQLGAPRAGLAHAPITEALAAADATALVPALAVAVALLCAVGLYGQLTVAAHRVPAAVPTLGAGVLTLPDQWLVLLACALLAVLRWATTGTDEVTGRGSIAGGGQLR